ncbi:hypothetical protein LLG95_10765 [bacterium]|nr:hypothetical protein [bacterium]
MTETPTNEPSAPIKRRVRITLIVLGGSFLFLVILFWAVSIGVNSIGAGDARVKQVEIDSVGPIKTVPMTRVVRPNEKAPIENVKPAGKIQVPVFGAYEKEYYDKVQLPAPESGPGAQYIKLVRRWRAEKLDADFKMAFPDRVIRTATSAAPLAERRQRGTTSQIHFTTRTLAWDGEPLTDAQAKWVRDHAELIAQIRRFAESDEPAPLNREEIDGLTVFGDDRDYVSLNSIRWNVFATCLRVLIADGTLCANEGRIDEALRDATDLYRIALKESTSERSGPQSWLFGLCNRAVCRWIESSPEMGVRAATLAAFLDDIHRSRLSAPVRKSNFEFIINDYYPSRRNRMAWKYAHSERYRSWKSSAYGYDLDTANFYEYWWVPNPRGDFQVPRVHRMLATAIKAMNRRAAAPGIEARQIDEEEQKSRIMAGWNWEVLHEHIKNNDPSQWLFTLEREYQSEAEFNLIRAALAWIKDKRSGEIARTMDLTKDYENPWRDPFIEKAFHVEETTSGTLIYSVGPDMEDQHGANLPEAFRGVIAPGGDIAIRIRR